MCKLSSVSFPLFPLLSFWPPAFFHELPSNFNILFFSSILNVGVSFIKSLSIRASPCLTIFCLCSVVD